MNKAVLLKEFRQQANLIAVEIDSLNLDYKKKASKANKMITEHRNIKITEISNMNLDSIEQLEFIKTCRSLGFTMQEIKAFNQLKQNPNQSCVIADELVASHLAQIEQKIQQLQTIQALLQTMSNCQQDSVDKCRVIHSLQFAPTLAEEGINLSTTELEAIR